MTSALMQVEGLSRRFGGLVAVDAVTLALRVGEVHAVIGTNGAGKSTLINMLSGEIAASAGRITLDGHDITTQTQMRRARAGVGRSYQRTTIFPEFTVHENCRLAAQAAAPRPWALWQSARACATSGGAADAALEATGLTALAAHTAGTLSHGAKRQLEVAMCLATRPRVLLLDEPLAGMGHEDVHVVADIIREVATERAVLMVEHNLKVVADLCHQVTVLQRGEILTSGDYRSVSQDERVRVAYMGTEDD